MVFNQPEPVRLFTKKSIKFVKRAKENRKHEEIKSLIEENQNLDIGNNFLIKDCIINLYKGTPIKNKRGNTHFKEEKVE